MKNKFDELLDDIIVELSFRVKGGYPDWKDTETLMELHNVLEELGLGEIAGELTDNLVREDEDRPEPPNGYVDIGGNPPHYIRDNDMRDDGTYDDDVQKFFLDGASIKRVDEEKEPDTDNKEEDDVEDTTPEIPAKQRDIFKDKGYQTQLDKEKKFYDKELDEYGTYLTDVVHGMISEDETNNYTHKGRGYYVKAGEEDKDDAQIYKRDGEKFEPVDRDEYEKATTDTPDTTAEPTVPGEPDSPDATDVPEPEEPPVKPAFDPDTSGGQNYLDSLPDGDPAKPDELKDEESDADLPDKASELSFKKPAKATITTKKSQLQSARKTIEKLDVDEKTEKAFDIFETSFEQLINADTETEQVKALSELAEYGFLERNYTGKQLYVANLPIGYKQMTTTGADVFSEYVTKLAEKHNINIPMRTTLATRTLADISGKHNEAGVVALLHDSDETKEEYEKFRESYSELGGNDVDAHEQNVKAAEAINKKIEETGGGNIKSAQQVGGMSDAELKKMGIDPKVDPTDIILNVERSDGTTETMKVSMKVYSNPNDITMKNAGIGSAGSDYLDDSSFDDMWDDIRKRNDWREEGLSSAEISKRKRLFRTEYLGEFSKRMQKLQSTPEGSERLLKMWHDVHGCGHDVYTSVTNKNTGETEVYNPDHYCNPQMPFEIDYDGVKVIIKMETKSDSYLQIDCKTEMAASPKILFKHKKKAKN